LNTRKVERIPGFNQDEGTEKMAFGTRGGMGPTNGTLTGNGKAGRKGDVWVEVQGELLAGLTSARISAAMSLAQKA
jgi:hypothetical protein